MAYRILAVDLDGTLLTADKKIPARAKYAIGRARKKGAIVVLSTGRTRKGAQRFYEELELDTLFIVSGGAEVYDRRGKALYKRYLDPDTAKRLLLYAYSNGIHAQVYIGGELTVRERNAYTELYEKHYGFPARVVPELLEKRIHTPKVLLIADAAKMSRIRADMQKKFPALSAKHSDPMYLEFSDPGADKGKALEFVADYYGVGREEIIAVGDSEIDVSMLEYAGFAAAVSNAEACAKENADLICGSNEQSGVADIIDRFFP